MEKQGAALTTRETINVTWNPLSIIDSNLFEINNPKVDISLLRYKKDTKEWEETALLATNLPNNGRASVRIPDIQPLDESQPLDLTLIHVTLNTSTSVTQSPRIKRNTISRVLGKLGKFSKPLAIQFVIDREYNPIEKLLLCQVWHFADGGVDRRSILPCPCRKEQAERDQDRYEQEKGTCPDILRENLFHPDSDSCYRQKTAR